MGGDLSDAELLEGQQAVGVGPVLSEFAVGERGVLIWSRLHGIVSLEIAGNFASMSIDPGQLFETELTALAT